MGVQIKASVINATKFFTLGGCEYEKGDWALFYINVQVDSSGSKNEEALQVGVAYKSDLTTVLQSALIYSNWLDGNGDPYPDLSTLLKDLATLLGYSRLYNYGYLKFQQQPFPSRY
jgi:hypothetical protein